MDTFNWKECCFISGNQALLDLRHWDRETVVQVRTLTLNQSILKICEERNDKWAVDVKCRLNCCVDLVASDAMYHFECYKLFSNNREYVRRKLKLFLLNQLYFINCSDLA